MSGKIQRRETLVPAAIVSSRGRAARRGDALSEFLGFELAGEYFGLPLQSIREILTHSPITEVPGARDHVLGILSVRGVMTTVMDLRRRLRMPSVAPTKASRILLVDGGMEEIVGLLVDRVFQVHRLKDEELELAATVAGDLSEYVHGIGRPHDFERAERSDDIMILLDPGPLLRR